MTFPPVDFCTLLNRSDKTGSGSAMSKQITVLAPRSSNISTKRAPQRPEDPVTIAVHPGVVWKPGAFGLDASFDVDASPSLVLLLSLLPNNPNTMVSKER